MKNTIAIAFALSTLIACNKKSNTYDASGTFEAVETIVSAEASGVIKQLNITEGQSIEAGQVIGYIDSTQLHLRKKQLDAQINAVLSRTPNAKAQIAALHEQLKQAENEQQRVIRLVKADAATQKQLDDVNAQVAIAKKQIAAQESALGITVNSINEETLPLSVQIEQLNDQLSKCRIINPVQGTVLIKYAETNEMTTAGKPLFKIAGLNKIILRAYVSGDQFANVNIGKKVTVLVDNGKNAYKEYEGVIEWISDKAEFTPKTIQTKDERANLVYAVKIKVKNDGFIKLGMYGEVMLGKD